jgi:HSP20 family protein
MSLPIRRHRPMVAHDPLEEFDDLFNRIGTLLETTVGTGLAPGAERVSWAPLADLTETDEAYVVEAELPGMKREDIDIQIGERELSITGELTEAVRQGTLHRSTRRSGRFAYRTTLPGQVDAEGVTATLYDGVLTVSIPKSPTAGLRHIEIQRAE